MKGYQTYIPRPDEIDRRWWLVDAEGQTLGRLATHLATMLRGKHRPSYSPHMDMGDYIVVVNAEKVAVTGNKLADKLYYRHSGYPGGLSERTLAQMMKRYPERVLRLAVRGMLPRNRLRPRQLDNLKVYAGPDHPHQAQKPAPLEIGEKMKEREA